MLRRLFILLPLLSACSSGPGSTPMEQDGLITLDAPHEARLLFTMDSLGAPPPELMPVFEEYKKTRLFLHIVWRTPQPPTTALLAQFPGKKIKQFWDPKLLTPSTNGQLRASGQLIPMELLSLRLAFARVAALPDGL